jgi:peptide/nickel transport system permease protein
MTIATAPPSPRPDASVRLGNAELLRMRIQVLWKEFRENWRIFLENKIGILGLSIIVIFLVITLIHPVLMATVWDRNIYDPVKGFDPTIAANPAPPSARHLLGTDSQGRDVLSQLMYSTRSEFVLGMIAALAAYYGGIIDIIFMRLADLVMMLPAISILIVLSALFPLGMAELAVVIGFLDGFGAATIVIKSQALTIKVRTYIEAARVAGGNDAHIIFNHIIPNLMPLSFLYMMFTVTDAIFSEAVLSFFGLLNIRMSWGLMIRLAETGGYLLRTDTWWLVIPPGLCITLLCSSFYLVGRALDEVVNPRLRRR